MDRNILKEDNIIKVNVKFVTESGKFPDTRKQKHQVSVYTISFIYLKRVSKISKIENGTGRETIFPVLFFYRSYQENKQTEGSSTGGKCEKRNSRSRSGGYI